VHSEGETGLEKEIKMQIVTDSGTDLWLPAEQTSERFTLCEGVRMTGYQWEG